MEENERRITLRVSAELHQRIIDAAKNDRRSVNSELIHLLEKALSQAQ